MIENWFATEESKVNGKDTHLTIRNFKLCYQASLLASFPCEERMRSAERLLDFILSVLRQIITQLRVRLIVPKKMFWNVRFQDT